MDFDAYSAAAFGRLPYRLKSFLQWVPVAAALALGACTSPESSTNIDTDTGSVAYTVGGTVSGLTGSGLVLQNNGGNNTTVAADGAFTFSTTLVSGNNYNVSVLTQPSNPTQTCTPNSAAGIIATASVTNVTVVCANKTVPEDTIGGTVSGLAGSGLQLQNNGTDTLAVASNGAFTFPTALAGGMPYSVTISSPPVNPNQNCVVAAGTGTTSASDVNNVAVSCTTASATTYSVGGSVSGLPAGTSLVLADNGRDNLKTGNGPFTFATPVPSGSAYSVSLVSSDYAQSQACVFTNANGLMGTSAVTNVAIACNPNVPVGLVSIEVTPAVPSVAN